jgi:hypothetical protein
MDNFVYSTKQEGIKFIPIDKTIMYLQLVATFKPEKTDVFYFWTWLGDVINFPYIRLHANENMICLCLLQRYANRIMFTINEKKYQYHIQKSNCKRSMTFVVHKFSRIASLQTLCYTNLFCLGITPDDVKKEINILEITKNVFTGGEMRHTFFR